MIHVLRGALAAVAISLLACTAAPNARAATIDEALAALETRSFAGKQEAIEALARLEHPRVLALLEALLAGEVHHRKSDRRAVIVTAGAEGYDLVDAVTGEPLGAAGRRDTRKVTVNNRLRNVLGEAIAIRRLSSADAAERLAAARAITEKPDAGTAALLRAALGREADEGVAEAIRVGLATLDARSGDAPLRLAAIATLGGSLHPQARVVVASIAAGEAEDAAIRAAASEALERIDRRLGLYRHAENLFFGLSLGSVLLLAAVGLAITFGVMGVINMAHGEMVMLGAYTTWLVQTLMPDAIGWSIPIAIPAAFLVAAAVGLAIEQGIIRHLYGRPLETLLATFGVSLILQQSVRSVFSPLNRSVSTPEWMSGSLEINAALSLTWNRLWIIGFALVVLAVLVVVLSRTRFGLQVRAVVQNRQMARAMGIRTGRIDALTFALGSGIAGIAGVALSQLTNVGPNMGQAYIVDSFMVVVFGGVGNLFGTFVGAMTLGVANKLLEPFAGAVLAKIAILVCIIVFIQRRPRGLFAPAGRSAES